MEDEDRKEGFITIYHDDHVSIYKHKNSDEVVIRNRKSCVLVRIKDVGNSLQLSTYYNVALSRLNEQVILKVYAG